MEDGEVVEPVQWVYLLREIRKDEFTRKLHSTRFSPAVKSYLFGLLSKTLHWLFLFRCFCIIVSCVVILNRGGPRTNTSFVCRKEKKGAGLFRLLPAFSGPRCKECVFVHKALRFLLFISVSWRCSWTLIFFLFCSWVGGGGAFLQLQRRL